MTLPARGCWCDDKSNEPCDGICRLLRDHERLEADLAALREAAQAVNDLMTGGVGQVPLYFDDQRCSYRAKTALLGLHVALTWPSVLSWRRADSESREETP